MNHKTNTRGLPRARRPLARVLTAGVGAVAVLLTAPAWSSAAVLSAAPGQLPGVFASAAPGDVIQLAPGDYGTFNGGQKAGTVTVQPTPGQSATMDVSFTNASNINLQGLTIGSANIGGSSRAITIGTSRISKMSTVDASSMANAGILFDRDIFDGIDATSSSYEGRLSVRGADNAAPVGVAVTNSHFGNGGCSDGVQIVGDANGVQVGPGNEFSGLKQGSGAPHVDSIQLYGSKNTQIVGNYFHDDDTIVMAPDGGENEVISDNVMVGGGYTPAVQLGSHQGSQFVHNTVKGIDVHMDHKSGAPPSTNGVVRDNIFIGGTTNALDAGNCSGCTVTSNLFASPRDASGVAALVAMPVFVGGANPTTYAGYQLAPGSPGKGAASDGADRGIRVQPSAAPTTAAPKASKPRRPLRLGVRVRRSVTWAQLRRGLLVTVSMKVKARVSLRMDRRGTKRSLGWLTRKNPGGTQAYRLKARRGRLGPPRRQTIVLTIRATNKAGRTATSKTTIRVRR